MGEQAKKIGDKLEGFGEKMYGRFGWDELVSNKEIKCIKAIHKNSNGERTRTHGIDLYHKYYDPYKQKTIGVITECKNYAWGSIATANLQKWFDQLLGTIECAQISQELNEYNKQCETNNTGILLVHANDGKYSDEKFREYLSNLTYKSRKSTTNIFIAGNNEIEKWDAMFECIEKEFNHNDFNFYYPSIMGSKLMKTKYITLDQLFSTYVFAENIKEVDYNSNGIVGKKGIVQSIVFSFDKIDKNGFLYLCNMFKELQLERADEYIFCFYPQKKEDCEYIKENFIECIKTQLESEKIRVIMLDNRRLSPVDTK